MEIILFNKKQIWALDCDTWSECKIDVVTGFAEILNVLFRPLDKW